MACLDTNVLIDLVGGGGNKRRGAARAFVASRIKLGETLTTTRINEAELRVGVERSVDRAGEARRVEAVLSCAVMLELDESSTARFGAIKARLLDLGRPAGDLDAMIAAICLANGQGLVTRNPKHFADIPGLTVETY